MPPQTVVIVVVVVAGFLILSFIIWYDLTRGTTGTCGIVKRIMFPDTCEGTCPVITSGLNSQCQAATTRPYGPFGWFGTQAASCTCVNPTTGGAMPGFPPVAGGTAGTGGGSSGGSGESSEEPEED